MQRGSFMKRAAGFTLVEIAIVLVIIGLILGSILKGQQLIAGARVRALADQINSVTVAWFAFQDRYRALPGDYRAARSQISDAASIKNGNGNGVISAGKEAGQVWAHLGNSGILIGTFDGADAAANVNCPATTCPQNAFNRGILVTSSNRAVNNATTAIELWSGNRVPAAILAELDRKIDDGRADSGKMQLSKSTGGWTDPGCRSKADTTLYDVLNNERNCAAVLRNF